jgi:hypothetical protein
VLVNTSAGSALPPERKVDYRPKDVALKDEGGELEAPRQINWAPFLALLALLAFGGLAYLGITQLGPQLGEMVAAGQRQIESWQAPAPQPATPNTVATLPPNLTAPDAAQVAVPATPAADAAAAGVGAATVPAPADSAPAAGSAPAVDAAPTAAPANPPAAETATDAPPSADAGALSLADLVPATAAEPAASPPAAEAAPETAPVPTPAPAPAAATVNTGANLRSGPGTDYPILAGLQVGQAITIAGRSADSTWFVLSDGSWVFGELVDNPPADVPVVEAPPLPAAAPAEAAPAAP